MSGAELYERWMDAYQSAYADPGDVGGLSCPSRGARALRLIFVVRPPDEERGVFTFWCDGCLTGLPSNPAPVPEDGVRVTRGEERVPNFRVVHP